MKQFVRAIVLVAALLVLVTPASAATQAQDRSGSHCVPIVALRSSLTVGVAEVSGVEAALKGSSKRCPPGDGVS